MIKESAEEKRLILASRK